MSTMKFGMRKKSVDSESTTSSGSGRSQGPLSPPVPVTSSAVSSSAPVVKKSLADLYTKGVSRISSKVTAEKSEHMPISAVPRDVKTKDVSKLCPTSFSEIDVAEKLREVDEIDVPEYEIVGAEISIYDIETLAGKNEAPQITSGDSTGDGSLGDPRMGVIENDAFCQTCGGNNIQCTGHFGYIKLSAPIYNPLFAPLIPKVLSCICITCGGTFLNEETIKEKGILRYDLEKRLNYLAEESASQLCQTCQAGEIETEEEDDQGKRKRGKRKVKGAPGSHFSFLWNKDCMQIQAEITGGECEDTIINGVRFLPSSGTTSGKKPRGCTVPIEDVQNILKTIDPKALELMGFENGHHPKNFIMNYLPVLPPVSRQPKFVEGKLIEDKLTEQYRTIISKNKALAVGNKDSRDNDVRALFDEIDKFVQGTEASKKGVFKSIKERLQGKEERIRGTIMGRRVNFSARTVLGPKPSIKFGQIALPRVWAKVLRKQEVVCDVNIKKLQKDLQEGRIHFIFPTDTKFKGLPVLVNDNIRKKYILQLGDTIERELMNGDYIIFNRQPTLHKQSMMGYQVVLHDEYTIGMHISTTRPHNADHDGDEGNVNVVSFYESIAEIQNLMNVKNCVLNSQTNRPIMSLAFDSITGAYQLTNDSTYFTKDIFYQLLSRVTRPISIKRLEEMGLKYNLIIKGDEGPLYSGKLLFSATLPPDFYYEYADGKNVISIREGILVSGRLSSKTIGAGHNSIIQALYKAYPRYGPFIEKDGDTEVAKFITDATFILDDYLAYDPITIGMEDCINDEKDRMEQEKIIQDSFMEAERAAYKIGQKLENPIQEQQRNAQIKRYLDSAKAVGGKVSQLAREDNALLAMIRSGAKGSETNFSQIGSMLGQMFYKGNQFPLAISDQTRCLPYFEPNSVDVRSRGFCINSFLTGLTPSELFFSQASGRTNLMDTALKTADVGDMHRRMVKIMEDIRVAYDGTVRNNKGRIFQFVYGDDGMDAAELQFVPTPTGNVPMFVDVFKEASKLNAKYMNQ